MGTLTNGVIATTYKNLVFQKTDNKFYYTNSSDVDTELTTFASDITFSGGAIVGGTLQVDTVGEKTSSGGVNIETVNFSDGNIKLGASGKINDSNGNEALHINTTSSAVNYFQVIPSATGDAVILDTGGDDTNVGLTLQTKGSGIVTCTPDLTVTGDLTVSGNDIKSSTATAITLSADDVTVVGDLTITGTSSGTMILGASADGADRRFKFGHSTIPVIMGIVDSQDVFAIHTGTDFITDNDFELDNSGNVSIAGTLTVGGVLSLPDSSTIKTTTSTAMTINSSGEVSFPKKLTVSDASGTSTFAGPVTCSKLVKLTGNSGPEPGAGITSATGEVHKSWVEYFGNNIVKTTIYIDVTGLRHTATNKVIGDDGTTTPAYIAKIVAADHGTIFSGRMTCLEVPDSTAINMAIYRSTSGTIKEGDAASGMAGTGMVCDGGDQSIGEVTVFTNTILPDANDYLYMVCDASGADADYTKGKFLIEMIIYLVQW